MSQSSLRRVLAGRGGRLALLAVLCAFLAVAVSACGSSSSSTGSAETSSEEASGEEASGGEEAGGEEEASAGGGGEYSVVVLNSYLGNTWRPVMIKTAEVLAEKAPLDESISSIKIVNTENTPAAQAAALQSITLDKPDLVVLDAASPTAVNAAIQQACTAGIVVVGFDQLPEAPCAWKIGVPFKQIGTAWASWLASEIGGKGQIIRDEGLEGAPASQESNEGIDAVLEENPGIEEVTFFGKYAPGDETSGVTQLASSNPNVNGVLSQAYGGYAIKVMSEGGSKPVPTTGWSYNVSLEQCEKTKTPCLMVSSPTWVVGSAMKLGIEVLNEEMTGEPKFVALETPVFTNTKTKFTNEVGPVEELDGAALKGANEGLMLPISPPWAELTPEEVLSK